MPKPKVFIDTNVINNPSSNPRLFGKMEKLKQLEDHIEIIIPKIVQEELLEHKRKAFNEEKAGLLSNNLLDRIASRDDVQNLEFSEPCIFENEDITFDVRDIVDYKGFYRWASDLALKHKAPFDNKTDKGFKDSTIAFVIDEYVNANGNKNMPVVLITSDSRLGEYFQDDDNVVCLKTLSELENWLNEQSKYDETEIDVVTENKTIPECQTTNVETPISTSRLLIARKLLTELRNSRSFAETHDVIKKLSPHVRFLTEEDYIDILISALENNQIMWIIDDSDVETFLKPIFDKYKDRLSIEQYNDFINRAGWLNYRIKEPKINFDDIPF